MPVVKYITVNGVRKLNPAWKAEQQRNEPHQSQAVVPFANRDTALPVVSYPTQQNLFQESEIVVVPPSYTEAVQQYQTVLAEAEIVVDPTTTGSDNDGHRLGQLAAVLGRYEAPAGMLAKLLGLRNYDAAEIIVDDSGSMTHCTDARGMHGESLTRWQEVQLRICQMVELVAYVKCPKIDVHFLNRSRVLQLERQRGESPQAFYERVKVLLENEFRNQPSGSTPALERIRESLQRHVGQRCLRYFMGDGVPDGGAYACRQIEQLLVTRPNPEANPFTFMSCTDHDAATEW